MIGSLIMIGNPSLFYQGLIFTVSAIILMGLITWFFYFSPLKKLPPKVSKPSTSLLLAIVSVVTLSTLLLVVGALWDASMHIETGEVPGGSDFLWPPHLLIYGGFLLSMIAALLAIGKIALENWQNKIRDPRVWVRSNPYLGFVAISALFTLISIPGDALWHELFGIDLTAWSPPHVLLALMSCIVVISGIGLLFQTHFSGKALLRRDGLVLFLLALMLNVAYIIGVLEWELPGFRSEHVLARPIWSYPLVGGLLAFITFTLAIRLTNLKWAASITAFLFYLVRFAVTTGLDLSGSVTPAFPLPFLLGGTLLDLVRLRTYRNPQLQTILESGAFCLGYGLFSRPYLASRPDLPTFTSLDFIMLFGLLFIAGMVLVPLLSRVSQPLVHRIQPAIMKSDLNIST